MSVGLDVDNIACANGAVPGVSGFDNAESRDKVRRATRLDQEETGYIDSRSGYPAGQS